MALDPTDPRPLREQIADYLRELAVTVGPGGKLPSESELRAELLTVSGQQVAGQTIRAAITVLKNEGLVAGQHGRGVFVLGQPPLMRLGPERFSRAARREGKAAQQVDAAAMGRTTRQEILDLTKIPAPPDIAEILGVPTGSKVFLRRRLELVDEVPNQIASSYYRLETIKQVPAIAEVLTGPGGSYARIEDTGLVIEWLDEEYGPSRMPTREESRLLRLSKGIPVMEVQRKAEVADGSVVELFRSVVNGRMVKITNRFKAPE
jgi:GntR family transcriptional regulator